MFTKFLKIGHRGASGYEPENTLLSFERASELGANMIEFDVRSCRTGEVVVMHDSTVNRTTNGVGHVRDYNFFELRKLDAGKGQKIPTLEEVLDLAEGRLKMNIELKDERSVKETATLVQKYISRNKFDQDDFLISSFDVIALTKFKEILPSIRVMPLRLFFSSAIYTLTENIDSHFIDVSFPFLKKSRIKKARKRGLNILTGVINDPKKIEYFKSLGVDGIFSDYPDLL
ncbi:MAG: glycerophosphodiester phosphodiesterase family protein [Candidatus Spechtbacterales bacterium]|nr:glycerophosphodiester phosphodiesterase family protein [Candidatus Spechtbacterales bacterium]